MGPPLSSQFANLIRGAAAVAGQADLRAVLAKTTETAMQLTGAPFGALGVVGEHGTLVEFIHAGLEPGVAERIGPLPTGRGVLGVIIRDGETIRLDHIADHPDSVGFPNHHPAIDSFLGVPIRAGDAVYGNLYLGDKPGGFSDDDCAIVESLAVVAGSAISTARLQARLRRLAVAEDRERIARDLHDAIIQDLFAVGLSLQGLALRTPDAELQEALEDAVARLDDAIASLRRFIFGLRPPAWMSRNVAAEIKALAAQLSEPYAPEVRIDASDDLGRVGEDTAENLVQIVREALSNALRHSGATEVVVRLVRMDDEVVASVTDDGIGFDPAAVRRGMGLDNLHRRATDAGGTLDIRSQLGVGSSVTTRLPAPDA